jgi:hypothetical protein
MPLNPTVKRKNFYIENVSFHFELFQNRVIRPQTTGHTVANDRSYGPVRRPDQPRMIG